MEAEKTIQDLKKINDYFDRQIEQSSYMTLGGEEHRIWLNKVKSAALSEDEVYQTDILDYTQNNEQSRLAILQRYLSLDPHPRDPLVKIIVLPTLYQYPAGMWHYIFNRLIKHDTFNSMMALLLQNGFSVKKIVQQVISTNGYHEKLYHTDEEGNEKLSKFAKFLKDQIALDVVSLDDIHEYTFANLEHDRFHFYNRTTECFRFLFTHFEDDMETWLIKYVLSHRNQINRQNLHMIMDKKDPKYRFFLRSLMERNLQTNHHLIIAEVLQKYFPGEYDDEKFERIDIFLDKTIGQTLVPYLYEAKFHPHLSPSVVLYDILAADDDPRSQKRLDRFFTDSPVFFPALIQHIFTKDEEKGAQYFPHLLTRKVENKIRQYEPLINQYLGEFGLPKYTNEALEFMSFYSSKDNRIEVARQLAQYPDTTFPVAQEYLKSKKKEAREAAAITLSALESETAKELLLHTLATERADDARDIMVQSIASDFTEENSIQNCQKRISNASKRGKLKKWNEKWLNFDDIKTINWVDGTPLSEEAVMYLFYRARRTKGLNSDLEAKLMIQLLDPKKSAVLAKQLLNAFINSNADTKYKYYLIMIGMTGGDAILDDLVRLFNKSIKDKRVKLAEYVLLAMAMIGSDKALRSVEVISRKYASKKPKLSAIARECLAAAAEELGITSDQLEDRIIPNFGFEGLFKTFDVEGEEYRAYITNDFSVHYLNESNKVRKSIPPKASKELKTELKQIAKDAKDIGKTQAGRLEKYMIQERYWPIEEWLSFFFENPLMFTYSTRLIWGLWDQEGSLIHTFYVSEDTCFYDVNDDEIDLDEGAKVSIMHPIFMDQDSLEPWSEKFYDLEIQTVFPQAKRRVYTPQEDELDLDYLGRYRRTEVLIGPDRAKTMLKRQGWLSSPVDGGMSEFYKIFPKYDITVNSGVSGVMVYYMQGEGECSITKTTFHKSGKWQERYLMRDVPPIIFSEIVACLTELIEAE